MAYKRSSDQTSRKSAMAPNAPPPLGAAEAAIFRSVVSIVAPDWVVELHGICTDEASLIVVPESGEDLTGPSFSVSRESYGFKLDRVRWDVMTEIGLYSSLTDVLVAIRRQLEFCCRSEYIGVTIH
nr:hypothetical protein [uncultured Rhodopila sp.]